MDTHMDQDAITRPPVAASLSALTPAVLAFSSPCYVYDPKLVVAAYAGLKEMLGTGLIVSLKANPDPDLYVRCAHAFVDGVEVASLKELDVVTGSHLKRFVNNPSMKADLIRAAVATRSTLIVDHLDQVEQIAAHVGCRPVEPVLLRINAAEAGFRHARNDHFGMDLSQAQEAVCRLGREGIGVRGLHFFGGSNSFRRTWESVATAVQSVIGPIETALGKPLQTLNLGGGFPHDWRVAAGDIGAYVQSLASLRGRYELLHESGRGIYGRAGCFMVSVVAVKPSSSRWIVVCDGGIAHNLLITGITSSIRRPGRPQLRTGSAGARLPSDRPLYIVGSSCSQDDVIGEAASGSPLPQVGDRLIFSDCGAYHQTFSAVDFLGLPRAKTYLSPLSDLLGGEGL